MKGRYMKFKLAGLLLFSQAATQATSIIDKNNYRQHLCDDGLFVPTPNPAPLPEDPDTGWQQAFVNADYQNYCGSKTRYQLAVESPRGTLGGHRPCLGGVSMTKDDCVQYWGMEYAKSCEKLKEDRANKASGWNAVVPTLSSCNNARRRRT